MLLYIIFIFVLQICYCAACDCSSGVPVPLYAIYLIGITISSLLIATVVLAVIVYKAKRVKGHDNSIFGKTRISVNKYERQLSEHSQRMNIRSSIDDDMVQLNLNEQICDDDEVDNNDTKATETIIEIEKNTIEPPKKVRRQPKVPIFPQMPEEQINQLCEAVLSRNRLKEAISLSDLDKIVNDAKEDAKEKSKIPDMSASTPALDVVDALPSPDPIIKLPVYDPNSQESKLRDEMKAIFNQDEFKSRFSQAKMKSQMKDSEIKLKDEINFKIDEEEINSVVNSQDNNILKPKQSEDNSKLRETMTKPPKNELMLKVNQAEIVSKCNPLSGDATESADKEIIQDDIYDCPPPPRLQNKSRDFPSSPHDEIYDFPPSPKLSNEIYDFPPSPKPSNEEYQSHQPLNDEIYECPPTSTSRNVIVNDDDATGYLFPISNSKEVLSNEPQYTNAKSVSDLNVSSA